MTNDPIRWELRRLAGDAGHVSYDVDLPTGCGSRRLSFSGNIFVGPVLVTTTDERGQWHREVIEEPRRFGEFVSADWVWSYLEWWHRENLLGRSGEGMGGVA